MSYRFRPNHRDANHGLIARALEAAGYLVHDLSAAGNGVTDLLVGRKRDKAILLVEIKRPFVSGAGMRRRDVALRKFQEDFHRKWAGFPVLVVTGVDEALQRLAEGGW